MSDPRFRPERVLDDVASDLRATAKDIEIESELPLPKGVTRQDVSDMRVEKIHDAIQNGR